MTEDPVQTSTGPFAMVPLWLPGALAENRPKAAGTAIIVFVALHHWTAGNDRSCYPSLNLIAEKAGIGLTACKDALKSLRAVGAVTWQQRQSDHGDRTSSLYALHYERPRSVVQATDPRRADDPRSGVQATEGSVAQAAANQTHVEADPQEPDPVQRRDASVAAIVSFDDFWSVYAEKKGKGGARMVWKKMTHADRRDAYEGARRHRRCLEEQPGEFILPAGDRWLRDRRWEDDEPRRPPRPERAPTRKEQVFADLVNNMSGGTG